MNFSKSILGAVIAAAGLIALLNPAAAASSDTVVKRDHRKPPIVRDHRDQPVVRDHRGVEGRTRPVRSPGTICAGWAC